MREISLTAWPGRRPGLESRLFEALESHVMKPLKISAVVALAMLAGAAFAQTPPAPDPAAAPAAVAKPSCGKPEPHPGRMASDNARKLWAKNVNTWQECMRKYIADVQAQANAFVSAANVAIDEYNTTSKEIQKQIEAVNEK
jgi:hypothetical protein